MFLWLCHLLGAVIYLLGYLLVALIAFHHNEDHSWAYCVIVLGAIIHLLLVFLEARRRRRRKAAKGLEG